MRSTLKPRLGDSLFVKACGRKLNVSLAQRADSTSFTINGKIPLLFYALVVAGFFIGLIGLLVVGVIGWVYLKRNWGEMEQDVTSLLLSASEFK